MHQFKPGESIRQDVQLHRSKMKPQQGKYRCRKAKNNKGALGA